MAQAIKAYMSERWSDTASDYPQPGTYVWNERREDWLASNEPGSGFGSSADAEDDLAAEALAEAQRILADVEPASAQSWPVIPGSMPALDAASVLAAITADGGPLDQLARSIPTIGQTSAIAHRNSTADVIAAAQRDLAVLRAYAAQRS